MRCDEPRWRLIVHPMRSNAASTCLALVEGQSGDGLSGGNEGHVHRAWDSLSVLQAVGDEAQGEGLDRGGGLFSGAAVGGHTRQRRDIRQPASILFPEVFDGQCEPSRSRRLRHDSMMPPNADG